MQSELDKDVGDDEDDDDDDAQLQRDRLIEDVRDRPCDASDHEMNCEPGMASRVPQGPPGPGWTEYTDDGKKWFYYEGPEGKFWTTEGHQVQPYVPNRAALPQDLLGPGWTEYIDDGKKWVSYEGADGKSWTTDFQELHPYVASKASAPADDNDDGNAGDDDAVDDGRQPQDDDGRGASVHRQHDEPAADGEDLGEDRLLHLNVQVALDVTLLDLAVQAERHDRREKRLRQDRVPPRKNNDQSSA